MIDTRCEYNTYARIYTHVYIYIYIYIFRPNLPSNLRTLSLCENSFKNVDCLDKEMLPHIKVMYVCVCVCECVFVFVFVFVCVWKNFHPCIYLSIYLSIYLCIHPSIC